MLEEVVRIMEPKEGKIFVDCTIGTGGHTLSLLQRGAKVVGLDCDAEAIMLCAQRLSPFKDKLHLIKGNFAALPSILRSVGFEKVDGILYDLGPSSLQLEDGRRGFSFYENGPLDMRMDKEQPTTAAELLKNLDVEQLSRIIKEFGQERWAKRIAKRIKKKLPTSTLSLARCVSECVPRGSGRIHPATRTFLALRIFLNKELDNLATSLKEAPYLVRGGGRIVVITFHSLEDRVVKEIFKQFSEKGVAKVSTKPICPTKEEVSKNPHARSAKLRYARILGNGEVS
jgi:16S rRNA (cytosine1402-N4)-methyltransferase